jgi:cephalosporin-C deacetylase-like acetyl esterase
MNRLRELERLAASRNAETINGPMRRLAYIAVCLIVLAAAVAGLAGKLLAPHFVHPPRRTSYSLREAGQRFSQVGATEVDFDVRADDGIELRGWKVVAPSPDGDWVLLYHGIADNRTGMLAHAEFLVRHGYSVVMMDSRAQGESGGGVATYGRKERYDTVSITNALYDGAQVRHLYALGVSMGAAIALQSAAVEPRICAVVAEDPFADLREITYDYAGLRTSPLLGETLFRFASIMVERDIEGRRVQCR